MSLVRTAAPSLVMLFFLLLAGCSGEGGKSGSAPPTVEANQAAKDSLKWHRKRLRVKGEFRGTDYRDGILCAYIRVSGGPHAVIDCILPAESRNKLIGLTGEVVVEGTGDSTIAGQLVLREAVLISP